MDDEGLICGSRKLHEEDHSRIAESDSEPLTNEDLFPVGTWMLAHVGDNGNYQIWGYNNGGHVVLRHFRNIKHLLASNKRDQDLFSMTAKRGEMVKVASLPPEVIHQWDLEQRSPEDRIKLLNSSDFAWSRTTDPSWRI